MTMRRPFEKRIGAVHIPEATDVLRSPRPRSLPEGYCPDPPRPDPIEPGLYEELQTLRPYEFKELIDLYKICRFSLKEGCYSLTFVPKQKYVFWPFYQGTLRVERNGNSGYIISGDLYTRRLLYELKREMVDISKHRFATSEHRLATSVHLAADAAADTSGVIPVYRRRDYYCYLKGTGVNMWTIVPYKSDCVFSLYFDEFRYQHPTSGYSGSFNTTPDRSIRWAMKAGDSDGHYTGTVYEGTVELGTVSFRWISPYFRRASLEIHTLKGAVAPQADTSSGELEDFHSVFTTATWDLSVKYAGEIELPEILEGVQDPNECWSSANSAELMESVPGYDPSELDTVWKARLLAIPAKLGCSRGRMFDSSTGDPNDIPREGAVTHSHDGYPAADSDHFGDAEDGLQKDFPRAFLRSASHEVGHTFNQIHQMFESGSDNSIMTVTPYVADALDADGLTFPDDINLGFNDTVQHHLRHLPDPAVRPGAMEFFGAAINAPEADNVEWLPDLRLTVTAAADSVGLGEPLPLEWEITNESDEAIPVPEEIDAESLTARISVTDPRGNITFMRPPNQKTCARIPIVNLKPGRSVSGSTTVFWGRDGFAFETPGRHTVEVIVLWDINGAHLAASGEKEIWVSYPVTNKENRIASLLLHPDVGRAMAFGTARRKGIAEKRIKSAVKINREHPACVKFDKLLHTK